MVDKFVHGYALVIGVGSCRYSPWSLPVTVKDAKALLGALTDPNLCAYPDNNINIRLLHDDEATRDTILNGLDWLRQASLSDPESTVVIYYSGHGFLSASDGNYYLIPHDVDPHNIASSALSAETFTNSIKKIKAQRLLVVIDSCHAEGMASSKDNVFSGFAETPPSQKFIRELKDGRGRAVFTSSSGTQKSWIRPDNEMSIYTFHFIEALKGASSYAGDTVVRLSNLMNHLNKTVPSSAYTLKNAEQIPFFDMATEDFAVSMLCGGKGLCSDISHHTREPIKNIKILQNALVMARHSLAILEEQSAGFGVLHTPAHLRVELEAKRREVSELENRLNN